MPNILDHIELWKADRSARISLPAGESVVGSLVGDADVTRRLGGVDELTLTLKSGCKFATATSSDAYQPSQGKIIRLVYDDASIQEWRILSRSREFSGQQNPRVHCEPISQDLKTYTVRKTLSNGHTRASVSFYNQTFQEIVTALLSTEYNCPALFTLGTVASGLNSETYNLVLNASYILEGLKKICQLADAEWGVTYDSGNDNYELNFYEAGGLGGGELQAPDRPVAMGGGKGNRLRLEKRDETEEYFSRVVPLMGSGSEIQTIADAKWNVSGATYNSGPAETTITLKEPAIVKDGYGLIEGKTVYFGNAADGWFEVIATTAPGQLTVSGDASAIAEGYLREGANKNDIIFLEDKQALDNVGLKEEKFSRPDIPPYANLIDDAGIAAAMSNWSSGLPVGMQKINGAETVSQEGSDLFVKHGTNSAKVSCNKDQGLETIDIDLQPEDLNPYFSTTVYVQVETGGVRIELVDADGTTHPTDQLAETNVNETRAIKIGGAEPAAGPAKIRIIAQSDSTVFYLDAITLTQSSYALPYAPLMGPKALWIEAGKHLKKYGGDRPDVWRGEVMDDAFSNSGSKEIEVGSFVKVQEDWNEDTQSYDSEFTVRVVECSYRENRIDGRIRKTVRLADKNSQASRVFQEQYLTRESQQSSVGVRSVPNKPIIDRENAVIEGGTPRFDQVEIFPDTGNAPFVLGSNAQGELVTGLNADQLDGYDAADFVRESADNTFTGITTFDSEARFNTFARFKTDGRIQGDGSGAVEVLANDGTNTGILRVDKVIVNTLEVAEEIDQTNRNELQVEDQFITVNSGQTGTPSLDGGLYAERGDQADSYMFWDEGNDKWGMKMGSAGSFDPFILESDIFPNGGYQALGTPDSPEWAGATINGLLTVGGDIYPDVNYTSNLGAVNKKFLTGHIAELNVELMTVSERRSTMGGRFNVGRATILEQSISSSDTTIITRHNNLNVGDIIHLEKPTQVEFMEVTSASDSSQPYSYGVTRDLDGSGANGWAEGDGIFNTGQPGEGFIDQYAINSLKTGQNTSGPTIAHMRRTGTGYNNIEPRAISGNLKGWYGYGSDIFGFGAGDPNAEHFTADPTNGARFKDGAGNVAAQFSSSLFKIGDGTNYLQFDVPSSALTGVFDDLDFDSSTFTLTSQGGMVIDSANGIDLSNGDFWHDDSSFRFGGANGIAYSGSGAISMGSDVELPFDNIINFDVGGTNLIQNSNFVNGTALWGTWNDTSLSVDSQNRGVVKQNSSPAYGIETTQFDVTAGEHITISLWVGSYAYCQQLGYLYFLYDGQSNERISGSIDVNSSSFDLEYRTKTVTVPKDGTVKILLGERDDAFETDEGFRVKDIKVERGSKATAWSPAPAPYLQSTKITSTTIESPTIIAGRIESDNLDRGSGTYTNTGTLFNLDQGDIISEEFSVINGIANFKGTLNSEVGGNIGGWEIYSGSEPYLQASNNGSIIQMKSGSQPEFYFQAPNGEELHIGGEYSFDQEDDVDLGSTSIGQVSEGANATSGDNISDTSSYYHTETLSNNYDGRVFEVSATYNADINVSGSGSATVRCEIILRFRDSSNNVLDTVSTSSSSGSDVTGKPISVSGVVPTGTDNVQVEVKLTANASAADDGKVNTASSSVTYNGNGDVMTVVGTNEFISPLGFSFVNEEQTGVTRKPRILGDRNTGRLLAHEFVVENEDGDQFTLEVTTGSNPQLRILDENGTAVDAFG